MKTPEERIESFTRVSLELNAELPTDIYLRGDNTFWIKTHGNDGSRLRKATNPEILRYLFKAIDTANRLISI